MKAIVDLEKLKETVNFLSIYTSDEVSTAIILGTGLGSLEDSFEVVKTIAYASIPHMPTSTTESHKGALVFAKSEGKNVILVSGRFHLYEGYSSAESVYIIHVLNALGIKNLIITNAVGGVNPHYMEGEIVLVNDHINFFPEHPLRGKNHESLGPKFPDMSEPYSKELRKLAIKHAAKKNIVLKEGVYFGWPGPSLETPAEYKMIHIIGADVVGMSTIPEVIVANYYGMKVLCFSVVSNVCYPKDRIKFTTVSDVIAVVSKSAQKLNSLVQDICLNIEEYK